MKVSISTHVNLETAVKIGSRCGVHMLLSEAWGVILRVADRAPGWYRVFVLKMPCSY